MERIKNKKNVSKNGVPNQRVIDNLKFATFRRLLGNCRTFA